MLHYLATNAYRTQQPMPRHLATYAYTHMYDTHTYVLQPDTQAIYYIWACNLC
jgi:hypothetical protein